MIMAVGYKDVIIVCTMVIRSTDPDARGDAGAMRVICGAVSKLTTVVVFLMP
jgi:hypothetical protein